MARAWPDVIADDPLIDEVRRIWREICAEFDNDVDRLFEHLKSVQDDYKQRKGIYSVATKEAAERVVQTWGPDAYAQDDPIVDEVREIRRKLWEGRSIDDPPAGLKG